MLAAFIIPPLKSYPAGILSENGRKNAKINGSGQVGRCGQGILKLFSSIATSKRPGRRNPLAASSATTSSSPAPNRRFCRFWTKKTTTCHPEESERVPRDSKKSELAYAVVYLLKQGSKRPLSKEAWIRDKPQSTYHRK